MFSHTYQNTTLLRSKHFANFAHSIVLTHVNLSILHFHRKTKLLELSHHTMFEWHFTLGNDKGLCCLESSTGIIQRLVLLEKSSHFLFRTVGEEQTTVSSQKFAKLAQVITILFLLRTAESNLHYTVLAKEKPIGYYNEMHYTCNRSTVHAAP